MITGRILGVIALVCASVWLIWRMFNYRDRPDVIEHFRDEDRPQ